MEDYIFIVVFFGIITCIALCLLFFVNKLSLKENSIKQKLYTIEKYIEERIIILNDMKTLIEKYFPQEEKLRKEIEKIKSILEEKKDIDTLKKTNTSCTKFNNLKNLYPHHAKEIILLETRYNDNKERIEYAADYYDKEVKEYNNYKENKILKILNKIIRFKEYSYYKDK